MMMQPPSKAKAMCLIELAFQAMQRRGANALIERIDCPARPASHLGCVPSFLQNDIVRLGGLARNL
jgi:proline dehydrogenase